MKLKELLLKLDFIAQNHPGVNRKKQITITYNSKDGHEYYGSRLTSTITYFLNINPIAGNINDYNGELTINNHNYYIKTYNSFDEAYSYVCNHDKPLYQLLKGINKPK